MSFRLGPVSTSSGTTAPGKITMSDKPRMGSTSGSDREETRLGSSDFSPEPRMLMNSVSWELVIVWSAAPSAASGKFMLVRCLR